MLCPVTAEQSTKATKVLQRLIQKRQQDNNVKCEQAKLKSSIQENHLGHTLPVNCPFVEELPTQVERHVNVGFGEWEEKGRA